MDRRSATEAYMNASIENAPPIKLVRMLYAGAIRFLEQAIELDPSDPRSEFIALCNRADEIVSELRLALDPEPNPDVAADLERLYLFVEQRLAQAMLHREHDPVIEARKVLETLLEAWNAVEVEASRVA